MIRAPAFPHDVGVDTTAMPADWYAAIGAAQPRLLQALDQAKGGRAVSGPDGLRLRAYAKRTTERCTPFGHLAVVAFGSFAEPTAPLPGLSIGELGVGSAANVLSMLDAEARQVIASADAELRPCRLLLELTDDRQLRLFEWLGTRATITKVELRGWARVLELSPEDYDELLEALLASHAMVPVDGVEWSSGRRDSHVVSREKEGVPTELVAKQVSFAVPEGLRDRGTLAARALHLLCPDQRMPSHLADYHSAFLERFDVDTVVPISMLLHPTWGLDAPAGYLHPQSGMRSASQRWSSNGSLQDQSHKVLPSAFVERFGASAWSRCEQFDLTEDDLTLLESAATSRPGPVDLIFELLGPVGSDASMGDGPILALSHHPGVAGFGRVLARFAHLGPWPSDAGAVIDRIEQEMGLEPVAVAYVPADRGLAELALCDGQFRRTIDVGASVRWEGRIDAEDVLVGASSDGFEIFDRATGRRLLPMPCSALFPRNAPNAARFLIEVGLSAFRQWDPRALLGRFDEAPVVPRVVVGDVVLFRRSWLVPTAIRRGLSQLGPPLTAAICEWRDAWDVPRRVLVGDHDRVMSVDLTDESDLALIARELGRSSITRVTEELSRTPALSTPRGAHLAEFALSLVPYELPDVRGRTSIGPAVVRSSIRSVLHQPFGGVMSIKLYGPYTGQVAFLKALSFAPVAPYIDGWFYLHYRDPRPHLRLRLLGAWPNVAEALLDWLHANVATAQANGWLASSQIDTYEPELERYGGASLQRRFHQVFVADSDLARGGLKSSGSRDEHYLAEAAFAVLVTLRSLGVSVPDHHSFAPARAVVPDRRHHSVLALLAARDRSWMSGVDNDSSSAMGTYRSAVSEYNTTLQARSDADATVGQEAIAASLTHLQLNRRFGIDPATETVVLSVALRYLRGDSRRAAQGNDVSL